MKKSRFFFCFFILLPGLLAAQDTLFYKKGAKVAVQVLDVNMGRVKYKPYPKGRRDSFSTHHLIKIVYADGSEMLFVKPRRTGAISYRQMMKTRFDSSFVKRNFVRLYLTDIYFNKISVGYEHLLNKNYSLEVDAHYRFSIGKQGILPATKWPQYYNSFSHGYEVKLGFSRHYHLRRNRASAGLALSYGEQSFSRQSFGSSQPAGYYGLDHKRTAFGLFLKLNYQFTPQHSGFEFFISPGFYAATTKNNYHSYQTGDPRTYTDDPARIPKIKSPDLKDGRSLVPYLNVGFAYCIKQSQQGWYKQLEHKRDSLRIHGKNTLLLNLTELIEGAIGVTYMRVPYKHALNMYVSAALGVKSISPPNISNSLLLEKNLNYSLASKNFDVLTAFNYNLSKRQRSFPFLGISGRVAQFEGTAYKQSFLLNKYYIYLNTGWMLRSDDGMSFLLTLAPGHYYNHYLSKDPHFRVSDGGLNSFYISTQIGFSF